MEKKLGEIIIEVKRKAEENSKAPVMMISATEGFINQSERYSSNNAGKSLKKYTLLKKGELAYNHGYSKTRNFGSCFTLEIEQARIPFVYHSFSLKGENDSVFWGKYLNSGLFDGKLRRLVASTARMDGLLNISFENYSSMPVNIPSLPEQKKIAAFFTLLDRRIQKQRQLVEFLKTYKRGVSEAIFERRLNFSSLLATEWKKYKLGQIGEFYNGLSGKSREDFGNGNCKFITYMNVYKNIIADESLCESVKIRKEEEQNSVKYGDVLFTQSSETLEEVGYTSVWTHSSQPYLNSFCFGYRFYDSVMTNPIFIAHYMRSNYIRKAIMKEGQGATRVNLSAERLKNLNIFLPDIKGQNKIAEFLSGLEDRIHKEESVLENMTMEKSSLLQKMFF